jgi:hypothetical protein
VLQDPALDARLASDLEIRDLYYEDELVHRDSRGDGDSRAPGDEVTEGACAEDEGGQAGDGLIRLDGIMV